MYAAPYCVSISAAAHTAQDIARCDAVPAVDAIDTHGFPWQPADAIEHDDPAVSPRPYLSDAVR